MMTPGCPQHSRRGHATIRIPDSARSTRPRSLLPATPRCRTARRSLSEPADRDPRRRRHHPRSGPRRHAQTPRHRSDPSPNPAGSSPREQSCRRVPTEPAAAHLAELMSELMGDENHAGARCGPRPCRGASTPAHGPEHGPRERERRVHQNGDGMRMMQPYRAHRFCSVIRA